MRSIHAPARRQRAAFTLVELMVAIGVLLVATLTAFSSQLTSMSLMHSSRETSTALGDLRGCMEQLLTLPLDQVPLPGSGYEPDQPVDAYSNLNLQDELIVPRYPGYVVGSPVPDPLTIVLRCTWSDHQGRPRFLELRSMMVR